MINIQTLLVIFIVLILTLSWKGYSLYRATLPTPILKWDVANEENTQNIDHSLWQEILAKYVHVNTNNERAFDYNNVSLSDREKLTHYLSELQSIDPRDYRKNEQLAYWINLYNALVIDLVLTHYPVKSIKEIGDGFTGPWNIIVANIANTAMSLNNIEHGVLRPLWQDMRIHYVINCASIGCPDLLVKPFASKDIDEQLNAAAVRFINQKKSVNLSGKTLILSSIYDWFSLDFGQDQQALIYHLIQYAKPTLKQQLQAFNGTAEFSYDWKLNGLTVGLYSSTNATSGQVGEQLISLQQSN